MFNWHTWYLVEELIPLSLFAENSDKMDKEEIQTLLLKYKDQELQTSYTKPQLPLVNTENVSRISSFCGPKSMLFLDIGVESTLLFVKDSVIVGSYRKTPCYYYI